MKMFSKKKNPATYDEKYLVEEINMTKAALSAAYANFDNATDPDLIDCYIYQLNSEQKRYKYLLQKAKESEIYAPNIYSKYVMYIKNMVYIIYTIYLVYCQYIFLYFLYFSNTITTFYYLTFKYSSFTL